MTSNSQLMADFDKQLRDAAHRKVLADKKKEVNAPYLMKFTHVCDYYSWMIESELKFGDKIPLKNGKYAEVIRTSGSDWSKLAVSLDDDMNDVVPISYFLSQYSKK